jgi:hypothetical protein
MECKKMTDKVENMTSNKGNKIANQFIIYTDNGSIFQSYNSTIVKIDSGKTYLDESKWNYSTTTGKYRNIFLNENINATRKKIKSGEYILTNLN